MQDIFEVQDEIARAIAEKLKLTLGAGVVKQSTKNAEAYDLYLKGRHFWHQRSPGTLRMAIEAFEEAVRLDSEYRLAYAGLDCCAPAGSPLAIRSRLNSASYLFVREFEASERAAGQALDLQAGYLFGLWNRGLALCGLGRAAEAINLLEEVVAVSRAPIYLGFLRLAYGRAGRSDDAQRLLSELDDRASRGEYVAAFARVYIHAGLNDLPAIRRTLAEAVEDRVVLFLGYAISLLPDEVRNDPEIHRLLMQI